MPSQLLGPFGQLSIFSSNPIPSASHNLGKTTVGALDNVCVSTMTGAMPVLSRILVYSAKSSGRHVLWRVGSA
jgi:hypothetical protein